MITDFTVIQAAAIQAQAFSIPSANLLAMIDVESDGKIFSPVVHDGKPEPYILFEPHKFYARLTEPARSEAVKLKIASKTWNKKLYPGTQEGRWDQIATARALLNKYDLDPDIAYECASWGVGQVLGEHWNELGYTSARAFIDRMRSGVDGQIEAMIKYCVRNNLLDELQKGQFTALARGYNGKSFKANKYDTRMEEAAKLYGNLSVPEPDGMLRMGSKGLRVRDLQTLLTRAGYAVKVDGDFGTDTKKKLMAYQTFAGIKADGVAGPQTMEKLGSLIQSADDKLGAQKPHEIKEIIQGAVVAIGGPGTINAAKNAVEAVKGEVTQYSGLLGVDWLLSGLGYVSIVLVFAGIAYGGYGWWKSKQTKET